VGNGNTVAHPTRLHRVGGYRDPSEFLAEQIGHFFPHDKDREKGKWVKVLRWVEPAEAIDLIRAGIERAGPGGVAKGQSDALA
jgi:inorganic pyrophosphatase